MKKFICVVLSVLMLAFLGFSAFAQDWEDEWVDIDCSAAGVTLMLPSSLLFNSQGSVDIFAADELGYKSGVYVTYLAYIGVTTDEYYNGDYEEDSFAPLLQIVGLKENYDSNAFSGTSIHIDFNQAYNIGTIGDVTFYAVIGTDVLPAGIQSPYAEEYVEESLSIDEQEKRLIIKALEKNRGRRKKAAEELHISERTLYRKIKEYGLEEQ